MKVDGRFRLELDIHYGDGSGELQKSRHDDPEGVILAFLTGLQEPNREYAISGSWFEAYTIYDLEKDKAYDNIDTYIDEMHNEKIPNDWEHPLTGGLISLANREIYHRAVKKALKVSEVYKMEYYNSKPKEDQFKYKCWKCGKPLTDANRSPLVYLSSPPKYACLGCDKDIISPLPGETIQAEMTIEPKVIRAFQSCDELIKEYCNRFNATHSANECPTIWVLRKGTDFKKAITEYCDFWVKVADENVTYTDLLEGFTFMDGSPIGVVE